MDVVGAGSPAGMADQDPTDDELFDDPEAEDEDAQELEDDPAYEPDEDDDMGRYKGG